MASVSFTDNEQSIGPNNIGTPSVARSWAEQTNLERLQGVANVALPIFAICKPLGYHFSLGLGALRSVSSLVELAACIQKGGDRAALTKQTLETAVAVISLAGTIFAHPIGMLITSGQDLLIDVEKLVRHVSKKEYAKALEDSAKILNNSLYLAFLLHGGLEIGIASLGMQVLLSVYYGQADLREGKYLEGTGHILMAGIRGWEMRNQIHILQFLTEFAKKSGSAKYPWDKIPDLLYAIKMKDPLVVKYLLSQGASVHMKDGHGATALHYAVLAQDPQLVELFLKKGVDMYAVADSICVICKIHVPGKTFQKIDRGGIPHGGSAYEFAIENDDLPTLGLFIKQGLRVDAPWYEKREWIVAEWPQGVYASPGFLALQYGRPKCLQLLAEQRSFSLPDEDAVWNALTDYPDHDDEVTPNARFEKWVGYNQGKGECISWLMDRFLFWPSPEILKYDLEDAYNFPSILEVLEQRCGNLDIWRGIEDEYDDDF